MNILQESCNAFRAWLLSITSKEVVLDVAEGGERITKKIGVDPFQYNTLASVCKATFRYLFLTEEFALETKCGQSLTEYTRNDDERRLYDESGNVVDPNTIQVKKRTFTLTPFARIPAIGFSGGDNHSRSSIVWLEYEAKRLNINIKHARNGGEHRVKSNNPNGKWLKLDGYHINEITGKETAFEYMGCVFHGCRRCYPQNGGKAKLRHPHTGQSMLELYDLTKSRLKHLR